jgi:hypothetical protein
MQHSCSIDTQLDSQAAKQCTWTAVQKTSCTAVQLPEQHGHRKHLSTTPEQTPTISCKIVRRPADGFYVAQRPLYCHGSSTNGRQCPCYMPYSLSWAVAHPTQKVLRIAQARTTTLHKEKGHTSQVSNSRTNTASLSNRCMPTSAPIHKFGTAQELLYCLQYLPLLLGKVEATGT